MCRVMSLSTKSCTAHSRVKHAAAGEVGGLLISSKKADKMFPESAPLLLRWSKSELPRTQTVWKNIYLALCKHLERLKICQTERAREGERDRVLYLHQLTHRHCARARSLTVDDDAPLLTYASAFKVHTRVFYHNKYQCLDVDSFFFK